MKRIICICVSVALGLLPGCAEPAEKPQFFCTQERVCDLRYGEREYDLLQSGEDTGIVIPGLKQNFVPQGICYIKAEDLILLSGYFMPLSGKLSSALLALDGATGELVGEYTLTDASGRNVGGHFSGIGASEWDLYVTGRNCLYRVALSSLLDAGSRGAIPVEQKIPMEISADACNFSQGELWVCEYYQEDKYPLEGNHEMRCEDQTVHHAWMLGYAVEDGLELKCIFSVPDKVQGITRLADGSFLLSQSYGRKNPSSVLIYEDPRGQMPDAVVEVDGEKIPLWHLDSGHLLQCVSAPPMSEGCCVKGEGVYLLFESAAYYYNGLDPNNRSTHPTDTIWYYKFEK